MSCYYLWGGFVHIGFTARGCYLRLLEGRGYRSWNASLPHGSATTHQPRDWCLPDVLMARLLAISFFFRKLPTKPDLRSLSDWGDRAASLEKKDQFFVLKNIFDLWVLRPFPFRVITVEDIKSSKAFAMFKLGRGAHKEGSTDKRPVRHLIKRLKSFSLFLFARQEPLSCWGG